MKTQDFDFYLPSSLIAQHPSSERTASRMLYLNSASSELTDKQFLDFPDFFKAGDLLIFNDTPAIYSFLMTPA